MALMDRQKMAIRCLQNLNRVAAGETPNGADYTLAMEFVNSGYAKLKNLGLAPFDIDLIPEFAQASIRDYCCGDLASMFGLDIARRQEFDMKKAQALAEMRVQFEANWNTMPVESWYF